MTASATLAEPIARPRKGGRPDLGRSALGVFGANKARPFHRWYPFVEGYSAELVEQALAHDAPDGVVLDPFGGSGTTSLAAAMLGRDSVFAEVNPYLAWIADVKVNQSRQVASGEGAQSLRQLTRLVDGTLPNADPLHPLIAADTRRGFFPNGVAEEVLGILGLIDEHLAGPTREVARLALASSLVPSSQMVRRTDLRKRTSSDPAPVALRSVVKKHLLEFAEDVELHGYAIAGRARHIAGDVRDEWIDEPDVAVVVTSPPYLNGTNYCRNTKLELLALGFIKTEADLKHLRVSMISAGINNVSKQRRSAAVIDCVEPVAQELDKVAYDVRIPELVRTYFSDMRDALINVRRRAVTGAHMYFDIGDSRYSGVHVPTHTLLRRIAEDEGWSFIDESVLRTRRSYDGSMLTQVLMHFEAV